MKKFFVNHPLLCFNIFAVLIALRDTFTQLLLLDNIDAFSILTSFFVVTTLAALIFNYCFGRSSIIKRLQNRQNGTLISIFSLGVLTLFAFTATVYGIQMIGAPVFSLIEHALIPVAMLFLATKFLGESLSSIMKLGFLVSILSLVVFLFSTTKSSSQETALIWFIGILLALLGAMLTAANSFFQKKLVQQNYTPDEVLFFRFVIPSLLMITVIPFRHASVHSSFNFEKITILSLFGFALPLVFLCFGFVRASFSRFSSFNILIPTYTFLIGPIVAKGELERLTQPMVILGVLGILLGFVMFEWPTIKSAWGSFFGKQLSEKSQ